MFDNPVVQTAIGMTLVFLGLSLATTAVQEFIASAVKLRAAALSAGLKQMLTSGQQGLDFYRKLMSHPVVTPAGSTPSYISAQQFSTATLHILNSAASAPAALQSLQLAIINLPDAPYRTALISLFREGEDTIDAYEKRIQTWFDQSMDRVSGTYKRWAQYISFVIGAVLAVALRADALAICYRLWSEPYLRGEIVNKAATLVQHAQDKVPSLPDISQVAPALILFHAADALSWRMLPGFAITAAAVTVGAPFWFDLLQRFVSLRGTGPTPKQSQAQGKKLSASPAA